MQVTKRWGNKIFFSQKKKNLNTQKGKQFGCNLTDTG